MTDTDEDEKLIEAMARAFCEVDRIPSDLERSLDSSERENWSLIKQQARRFLAMQRAYEAHEALVEFEAERMLDEIDPTKTVFEGDIAALREERDRLENAQAHIIARIVRACNDGKIDEDLMKWLCRGEAALATDTKGNEDG